MTKKFELDKSTALEFEGRTLYRIRALKNFGQIKAGELGGYVQHEKNLQQKGNCWIYGSAKVMDESRVEINARVSGITVIKDHTTVTDQAVVGGGTTVSGCVFISGQALIYDTPTISGFVSITDRATVAGSVVIDGSDIEIAGRATLRGDAIITNNRDYLVIKGVTRQHMTYTFSNHMWNVQDFYGLSDFHGTRGDLARAVRDSVTDIDFNDYSPYIHFVKTLENQQKENTTDDN